MDNLFKLANCEEFGDYIVANRDLEEGKIILKEEPLLSFPAKRNDTGILHFPCVGCFRSLSPGGLTCSECHFPICSPFCSKETFHSELECKLFAEKRIEPSYFVYQCLKYIRVFASIKAFPARYEKFQLLASEMDPASEKYSTEMDGDCRVLWNFLTTRCQMAVTFSVVKKVYSAFKINSFLIDSEDETGSKFSGYAVLEIASKFSHGCFPNTEWFFVKRDTKNGVTHWDLRLHCKRAIKKGEILCIAYTTTGLNYGTGMRTLVLVKELPFDCVCSRCEDATEAGTFFASHKCRKCKKGDLLPENPRSSFTSSWKCSNCTSVVEGSEILNEIEKVETHIKRYTLGDLTSSRKEGLDSVIKEHSGKTLHANHFLLFNATLNWLSECDFRHELMAQSKESTKLFQKIMTRFFRCLSLAERFMHTVAIARLELTVVKVVAAYAFRSEDCVQINVGSGNPRRNLRFSKFLLKHLNHGRFWLQKQANCRLRAFQEMLATLNGRCTLWTSRCETYRQELLIYQDKKEQKAFRKLRSIYK